MNANNSYKDLMIGLFQSYEALIVVIYRSVEGQLICNDHRQWHNLHKRNFIEFGRIQYC